MSEHRDGSAVRVTTAPWRTNFLAGFMRAAHAPFGPAKAVQRKRCRAIPGLVSLGTFFASKESTSATPKAFKTLAAQAKII